MSQEISEVLDRALLRGRSLESLRAAGIPEEYVLEAQRRQLERIQQRDVNPVAAIANSPSHIIISAPTGSGKTTLLKAIIAQSCRHWSEQGTPCSWSIVTFKSDNFFGLYSKKEQRVVTYIDPPNFEEIDLDRVYDATPSFGDNAWVEPLYREARRVYSLMQARIKENRSRLRKGLPEKKYPPAYLLLDEYSSIVMMLKGLPKITVMVESTTSSGNPTL